jgi:hypothetical protein
LRRKSFEETHGNAPLKRSSIDEHLRRRCSLNSIAAVCAGPIPPGVLALAPGGRLRLCNFAEIVGSGGVVLKARHRCQVTRRLLFFGLDFREDLSGHFPFRPMEA